MENENDYENGKPLDRKICAVIPIRRDAVTGTDCYRRAMATLSERLTDNVAGRYYTDSTCIDCDQCRVIAPELFERNADTGMSFVKKQPITDAEVALAEEAMAACSTESIGNDGQ